MENMTFSDEEGNLELGLGQETLVKLKGCKTTFTLV